MHFLLPRLTPLGLARVVVLDVMAMAIGGIVVGVVVVMVPLLVVVLLPLLLDRRIPILHIFIDKFRVFLEIDFR